MIFIVATIQFLPRLTKLERVEILHIQARALSAFPKTDVEEIFDHMKAVPTFKKLLIYGLDSEQPNYVHSFA